MLPAHVDRGADRLRGNLVDESVHDIRTVIGQQVLTTQAVELHVADAVAAADHSLRCELIRKPHARREVMRVRMDQVRDGTELPLEAKISDLLARQKVR